MAKLKSKNSGATNPFAQKKKEKKVEIVPKTSNPFEVHTNREKISILGRKLKHDKGMPGVSRAKATKMRKETLGREYLQKNKVNKFRDSRIGKTGMSKEDAANARFIAERLNQYKSKKQSRFNLNDNEEVLTHKGQTLEELEQFHDTISDDDDDEIGKLDAEFTGAAHFGGKDLESDGFKRKGAIEDLIADQKRRKAEISMEKETVHQLTNKLDENWKDLLGLMDLKKDQEEDKPKPDDFDKALKEMVFERRGTVTDKLGTEEKLLKKEKARLERLEQERIDRMHGITEEEKKPKHRSADDLDDGYFLHAEVHEQEALAYNEHGKANRNDYDSDEELDRLIALSKSNGNDVKQDEESGSEEGESSDGEEEEDEEEGEEEEENAEDDFSDLVYDGESDSELSRSNASSKKSNKSKTQKMPPKPFTEEDRKAMMEKAEKELPYTFELPSNYEELEILLKKHNSDYQAVIIDRMIKCNHPKVEPTNRPKMVALFAYLLQYINDISSEEEENVSRCFEILDRITPYLYDLSHLNPAETTKCFLEVIKEKQSEFRDSKHFPKLDTLVFLKLVTNLYSTSDFRHTIVSPCVIFISQILTHSRVKTRSDISSGLFLVTTILEYTQLSRRYLPAAINFLAGVLFLSIKKRSVQPLKVVPPFKEHGELSSLLVLDEPTKFIKEQRLIATDLIETDIDNDFKLRAFNTTLLLTNHLLSKLDDNNPGSKFLAQSFTNYLQKISFKYYPNEVKVNAVALKKTIQIIDDQELTYLVPELRKPKTLRQLEPKFERIYDDKRDRNRNAGKFAERNSLKRKIKSETKGAVREIRRDNAFLSRVELKRTLQRYLTENEINSIEINKCSFFSGMPNVRIKLSAYSLKHLFNKVNLMLWIARKNICKFILELFSILLLKINKKTNSLYQLASHGF